MMLSPPQPSLRPAQSPILLQQQHQNTCLKMYFGVGSAHKRYIRKDLVHKREKSHQEDSWLKGSGKVLDEECSLNNNLERGVVEPKGVKGVNKPETNLLERQFRKRIGADALPRLPWATS